MDARDSVDGLEDTIGSAKPPKPPRSRDPERAKLILLQVIAVGVAVTAVFAGINAWETHQDRVQTKTLYCMAYADAGSSGDPDFDKQQKELAEALDC